MDSTPEASREEKSLINSSLQFADMLNLGGGVQRQQTTAGMDSNKRMNWTRLRDGDLSVKKFKKMKEVSKLRFLFKKTLFYARSPFPPPLLARFARGSQGDPSVWGKAYTTVHTTTEQVLAFVWFHCSNLRMKEHQKKDGNLIRKVYEPIVINTAPSAQHHTQHIVVQKSMPSPFQPRETNLKYVWGEISNTNNNNNNNNHKEEDSKTLVVAFEPAGINFISELRGFRRTAKKTFSRMISSVRFSKRSKRPAERTSNPTVHPTNNGKEEQSLGVAQLELKGVWVITPLAQNLCEVTYVVNIVDKGKIPTSIINASIGRALTTLAFLKVFYERTGLVVDAEVSERRERAS